MSDFFNYNPVSAQVDASEHTSAHTIKDPPLYSPSIRIYILSSHGNWLNTSS